MMRKILAGAALSLLMAGTVLAQAKTITGARDDAPPAATPPDMASTMGADLSGSWNVAGTNPDGSTYSGTVMLTRNGPVYDCLQIIGEAQIACTTMQSGNNIATVYDGAAISLYQLRPDGTIAGAWTVLGANVTGEEIWTRQ